MFERAVDRLTERDGADEPLEELTVAADDVDLGLGHGLGHDVGLRRDDVLFDLERLERDRAIFLDVEPELFVTAARFVERLHGRRLLRQALRFGRQLFADGRRFGRALLLDRSRLRLAHPHLG